MHQPTIFFFDEYTAARAESAQAAERLLLEGRLPNGWLFHPQVIFAIGGNLPEHGPTISELAPTTKTRVITLLIESTVEGWLAWAREHEIAPSIIAWVAQNPAVLNDFSPERNASGYSVPRTLALLHHDVTVYGDDADELALAAQGRIGPMAAPGFATRSNAPPGVTARHPA